MDVLIFLVWIGAAVAVGYAASQRGRSGTAWLLLALAVSPLLGVLILMACPAIQPDEATAEQEENSLLGLARRVEREPEACFFCGKAHSGENAAEECRRSRLFTSNAHGDAATG